MRAILCSAILWIALVFAVMPIPVQAQGSGARQGGTAAQGSQAVNPLIEGVLQQMLDQITQPPGPPPRPNDDVQPPRGTNDPAPPAEVPNNDRAGPVITPAQAEFSSRSRAARVRATITDSSGVARAVVNTGTGQLTMRATGQNGYEADVPLAPHYRPLRMSLQAWDTRRNASAVVPVVIRRVPVCGRTEGVSVPLVEAVQRNLAALNRYDGGIDGLAGPNTCRAIAEAGFNEAFYWPRLLRDLDDLVALSLIELEVEPPGEIQRQITPVQVRVRDPGNTGAAIWVRMLVDDVPVSDQPNGAATLIFEISLAEGVSRRVTFLALDRSKNRRLAQKTITLTRPEALRLMLSGDSLAGSRLESEAAQVTLMAELGSAQTGRIHYENSQTGDRDVLPYAGQAVAVTLTMPAPGARTIVTFWAESGARVVPRRRIELLRPWVHVPDVWIADLALPPAPTTDPGAGLTPARSLPPASPAPPAELQSLAPDPEPVPIPPPPSPPGIAWWVLPVAIGVLVLLGVLLLRRRGKARRPKAPKAPPPIRVVAVPDRTPGTKVSGVDMPGLVLTVEPGSQGAWVMEFEDALEDAEQ